MGAGEGVGLKAYYKSKIEELELRVKDKTHNLRRLEAQRNELNTQGVQLHLMPTGSTAQQGSFGVVSSSARRGAAIHAVRLLREELQLLQEPGSYVGEVIKASEPTGFRLLALPSAQISTATVSCAHSFKTAGFLVTNVGDGQKQGAGKGPPRRQVCR